jgi:Trk K+ transport system NAD-binding subunit
MAAPQPNTPPRPAASEDEVRLERLRLRRRSYPLWRLIWANLRDDARLLRQAWFPLISLLLVLAGGTLYLLLIYFPASCASAGAPCDVDLALALYATLQLLIFQSGLAFPADPAGRLLFFAIPLLGLFFLLQSAIDLGRLLFDKSISPAAWQVSLASTFSDHLIICGLSRVGYRAVLQLLDSGYDVVAIDLNWDGEFVSTVLRLKVPVILGDARDPDVLAQAGLGRARGLIAAIDDDLKNIEIALTARRRRPDLPTVLRIFNRQLDISLERSFGRNSAFSSSALAAPTFAAAAMSRAIVHVLGLPEDLLGVSEITVASESVLCGFTRSLEDRYAVRLLRHRDQSGRERRPGFMQKVDSGDVLLLLGRLDDLERARLDNLPDSKIGFLRPAVLQRPTARYNTVIVCGMGKVGTQVVRLLAARVPRPEIVAICTPATAAAVVAELEALDVRVLRGDPSDPALLEQAGLLRAYSVASLFSDDLTNLQVGLAARGLRPDVHLVLRVFSDVLAERLSALFGINTAYSTSALAAPTLAAAAVLRDIQHAFDVGERLYATQTARAQAGDQLAGQSVGELRERLGLLVVALRRAGQAHNPPPLDMQVASGDELVLLGPLHNLPRGRDGQAASAPQKRKPR